MKRRLLSVLIALTIIPMAVTAAPFFQVGPLVSYNKTVVEMQDSVEGGDEWDINNFSFGADIRINPLKHLSIDIPATLGFGNHGSVSIALIPTANVNIPITGLFDLAIGVGPQFDFQYIGDNKDWTMNGLPMENAGDAFAQSKLAYRAGATFNLAFLSVGLNATIPCKTSFSEGGWDVINPMWESTRVSAVALFNFG